MSCIMALPRAVLRAREKGGRVNSPRTPPTWKTLTLLLSLLPWLVAPVYEAEQRS
jgi:hypothetical protein